MCLSFYGTKIARKFQKKRYICRIVSPAFARRETPGRMGGRRVRIFRIDFEMMRKTLLLLLAALCGAMTASAQDLIVRRDSTKVEANVLEISTEAVR